MTDDLLQAVRDLPKVSRYLHVPAQSGCDEVLKRMKRMYTVALLRRDARPDPRDGARAWRSRATSSSASAARPRRRSRRSVRAGRAVPVQEQLHLQVQPAAGHEGRRRSSPTTCPRRSRSGGTTTCSPSRTRSAWRTTGRSSAGRSRSWSRGRASRPARRDGRDGLGQLTGRTACDRIVVFEGPERLVGQFVPVAVEDASAVTLFGRVVTTESDRSRLGREGDESDGEPSSTTWWVVGSRRSGIDPRPRARRRPRSRRRSAAAPTRAGPGPTRADRRLGAAARVPRCPRASAPGCVLSDGFYRRRAR